jgi:hypothetical protein
LSERASNLRYFYLPAEHYRRKIDEIHSLYKFPADRTDAADCRGSSVPICGIRSIRWEFALIQHLIGASQTSYGSG